MSEIEREKETFRKMVALYCRGYEKNRNLCPGCIELISYACERLDKCKFKSAKPSCKKCPVHCYKPAMRARVKEVMRYAGPRMIWYAPWAAIRHLRNL